MIAPKPSVATRPKQLLPDSKKDISWAINNIDWCISMAPFFRRTKEDRFYNLYNGKRDMDRFKSITATYGIEYPVGKMKHMPLIRPMLHRLAGQLQDKPWGISIRASDDDAVEIKTQEMGNQILNDVIEGIKSNDTNAVDVFLDKTEKYYRETFQTDFEIGAHHLLEDYRLRFDLEQKFWDAFVDKEVTGREHYYCRVNRIGEHPEFSIIRPGTLFYADDNVKWIRETGWAVHCKRMAPAEIIDRWGEKMSSEEIHRLENWMDMYTHDQFKVYSPAEIDLLLNRDAEDVYSQTSNWYEKVNVYFVEWKSEREVNIMESPNRYDTDTPIIKDVSGDKLWDIRGARKNNVRKRYLQDLWQGVRIGDDMFVDVGCVKYPRRDALQPSKVHLSFNGPTYNGKVKPFSLVEVTEDLQDLYDIMHFHKENLVAMSGTRGSYMDISQLPDFGEGDFEGNLKMWLYYKKMGTAFVDRAQDAADKNFNQFPTYDDTINPSLSVVLELIKHIEDLAGRIIGVNRQSLGDVGKYEGKATNQSALENSSLTTTPFFNEHDEFTRMACEDIVNALKVTHPKGRQGSYVNNQFLQTIFNVSPEFSAHDYNTYLTFRMSDQRSIDELRQWAYKLLDSQMLQFEDILPLFRKSNLKDMEITIRKGIDERRKAAEAQTQMAQQIQQQIGQLSVAEKQAEIQKLQAQVRQLLADAERLTATANLEERALAIEEKSVQGKLENDSRRVDLESKEVDVALEQGRQQGSNSREVRNK